MINKRGIWFVTLFSLILVLSIYYITMPNEVLLNNDYIDVISNIEEASIITVLKEENEINIEKEMNELRVILNDDEKTSLEKSDAFDKLKQINLTKGEEESLEKLVLNEFDLNSFIKIDNDKIKVVIESNNLDLKTSNEIMKMIQNNYDDKKYITVSYQS